MWTCTVCTYINVPASRKCSMCDSPRVEEILHCKTCTYSNVPSAKRCSLCDATLVLSSSPSSSLSSLSSSLPYALSHTHPTLLSQEMPTRHPDEPSLSLLSIECVCPHIHTYIINFNDLTWVKFVPSATEDP